MGEGKNGRYTSSVCGRFSRFKSSPSRRKYPSTSYHYSKKRELRNENTHINWTAHTVRRFTLHNIQPKSASVYPFVIICASLNNTYSVHVPHASTTQLATNFQKLNPIPKEGTTITRPLIPVNPIIIIPYHGQVW